MDSATRIAMMTKSGGGMRVDIFERLTNRIDRLPDGAAKTGLAAVKLHIGTAIRHLDRGEASRDETAFTDAILRCNHAFEGSVKEAYRVLAGQEPKNKTPAHIEAYMKENDVLRAKVLAQFENYRKEWRNPSTHNYLLDFDGNEALLAIVSVTVFAVVLCDQIRGKLAFDSANKNADHSGAKTPTNQPLVEQVKAIVRQFAIEATSGNIDMIDFDLGTVDDALAGYLSGEWGGNDGIKIELEADLAYRDDETTYADILITRGNEAVAIESRDRNSYVGSGKLAPTVNMLETLIKIKSITGAVLFLIDDEHDYSDKEKQLPAVNSNILIVG